MQHGLLLSQVLSLGTEVQNKVIMDVLEHVPEKAFVSTSRNCGHEYHVQVIRSGATMHSCNLRPLKRDLFSQLVLLNFQVGLLRFALLP